MKGERGAVLVLVLAFMALAVPLVSALLALATTLARDSAMKARTAQSQYAVLGGGEHAFYRLRHEPGYADSIPQGAPDTYTLTLNGRAVSVSVRRPAEPLGPPPPPGADSRPRLPASKGVTPTSAPPNTPTTYTYTITVQNRGRQESPLDSVHDALPPGFTYVPGSTRGLTTHDPTLDDGVLTWDLSGQGIRLLPGATTTLMFSAQASVGTGNYCNEAWVDPAGYRTSSGKTAGIRVGSPANDLCAGPAVALSKDASTATQPPAYEVVVHAGGVVTYTLRVRNIGSVAVNLGRVRDFLPPGFTYIAGSTGGDLTTADPSITRVQGGERLDWTFSPKKRLQPGESKVIFFQARATAPPGDYWNEAQLTFNEFPTPVAVWPTARVQVIAVFHITATDGESTHFREVWLAPDGPVTTHWELSR
ncbi:hypothetical protein HRbin23_01184 [bacterium HR23]|nr:hypothetical protein HRbin23_01184 [bacterium HR23]